MAEETVDRQEVPNVVPAAVAQGLQDQIDALTETLEHHQRLFERLRASGVLTDEEGQHGR